MNVNEMRRRRDRMRRDRDTRLRQQLRLAGELLCDSHMHGLTMREIIGRMMKAIIELLRVKLDDEKRQSLAAVFDQSRWREEGVVEISYDGNMIHLKGEFDMRELAKRMVWIDVAEHEKVVEEDYD